MKRKVLFTGEGNSSTFRSKASSDRMMTKSEHGSESTSVVRSLISQKPDTYYEKLYKEALGNVYCLIALNRSL